MNSSKFIQRELSWNAFNARVMTEGTRGDLKLLDHLKFMAITSSNYDDFFMVHVARLMREVMEGDSPRPPAGEQPSVILARLLEEIGQVVEKQDKEVSLRILPGLAEEGLVILPPEKWGTEEKHKAETIFRQELFPVCTPIALTPERPLKSLAVQGAIFAAFMLDKDGLAIARLPDNLQRFRSLQLSSGSRVILLLDDILLSCGRRFFPGRQIQGACLFRVTRDADMNVDEERDEDFIAAMEEVLENRKSGFPVRLETQGNMETASRLREMLSLSPAGHFHLKGPLNLKSFFHLVFLPGFDHLRTPSPVPKPARELARNDDIWETLKNKDVLLHHPYETYTPVIRMVEEASDDPATIAIKMTLYRTSGDSPIVSALIRAAERGVQVTVLVELKARFDENANIGWAERLEKAGAIVVYGLAVLKVHAKAMMVVRKEKTGIFRYVHLGTGNYNDSTATLYTDMGLMSSREDYTRDTTLLFNAITGYSSEPHLSVLTMAPFSLRRETLRLIQREEQRAGSGEEARIVAKMNALTDPEIIEALYSASQQGVKIDLNVRGICCLKPGVPGLSENIRVISIIDMFLEHTRAFMYFNGGRQDVFLSSADWMTRNLDHRVELLFPVSSPEHKHRIASALESYFMDNTHAWELNADGTWKKIIPGKGTAEFRAQESFARKAAENAAEREKCERKALKVRRKAP